ncbi:MAG: DUF4365 domain-containing protein [Spirulinaceae cyanobacterium RM2_2_10]|nr:DUF4365 domain-containing protein [Spirulinaceae cyanobacterium RM2_2_10]
MAAICAQAGLNFRKWEWDDGIDMEVGSNKTIDGLCLPNIAIPLQVKATASWSVANDLIAFPLKAKNYTRLREEGLMYPQYLVLYTLPQNPDDWIEYEENHCKLFNCAFYLNLAGQPALPINTDGTTQETKTVHVPIANRLTGHALNELFIQACESVKSWRNGHA